MVYENNCRPTLPDLPAHEFLRVTRPTFVYYVATDVYTYVSTINTYFIKVLFSYGVRIVEVDIL